jgi:putative Mg2+ transporter-C (MgtC) family protein
MPISLEWYDVVLRLALTVAAGACLGIDRSEHSRPAGLRTVLLVCFAASLAMILANRLLDTAGKPADSFVQLDMMRLPLGILTGVGFIGAGAIIRRQDIVLGVTTAATLWLASVVGLCLGAGQLGLGIAGMLLGLIVLMGLRRIETYLPQDHRATLTLVVGPDAGVNEEDIREGLIAEHYLPGLLSVTYVNRGQRREYGWDIGWTGRGGAEVRLPGFLGEIAERPGVLELSWRPGSLRKLRGAER